MSPYSRHSADTGTSPSPLGRSRPSTRRGNRFVAADLQQIISEVATMSISAKSPSMAASLQPSEDASTFSLPLEDDLESMRAELWKGVARTTPITSALPNSPAPAGPALEEMMASADSYKAFLASLSATPTVSTTPSELYALVPPTFVTPPDLSDEQDYYRPINDYSDPSAPAYRTSSSRVTRQRRQATSDPYSRGRSGRRRPAAYSYEYDRSPVTSDAELSEYSRGESPGPQTPSWSETDLSPADLMISDPFDMGNRYESVDLGAPSYSLVDWFEQGAKGGDRLPSGPAYEEGAGVEGAVLGETFDDPWGMFAGAGTQGSAVCGSTYPLADGYQGLELYQEDNAMVEYQAAPAEVSTYSYAALDEGLPALQIYYADEDSHPVLFNVGTYTPSPSSSKRRTTRRLPSLSTIERSQRDRRMIKTRASGRDGYDADEDEDTEYRPRKVAGANGEVCWKVRMLASSEVPMVVEEEPMERIIKKLRETRI